MVIFNDEVEFFGVILEHRYHNSDAYRTKPGNKNEGTGRQSLSDKSCPNSRDYNEFKSMNAPSKVHCYCSAPFISCLVGMWTQYCLIFLMFFKISHKSGFSC